MGPFADRASDWSRELRPNRHPHTRFAEIESLSLGKRFIIDKFILDKPYRYMDQGMDLQFISTDTDPSLELQFVPKVKQKVAKMQFNFADMLVNRRIFQRLRNPRGAFFVI